MAFWLRLALVAGSMVWLGCSGSDRPPAFDERGGDGAADDGHVGGPTGDTLPECPDADYRSCDIRQAACRTRLASMVACVRGDDEPVEVPFEIWSTREVSSELTTAYADADTAAYAPFEAALAMLGLVAPGSLSVDEAIDEFVEYVPAFYNALDKLIVIVDRGEPTDPDYDSLMLVHEYVHALQDAEFDLYSLHEAYVDSDDSFLALRALIEGEATYYETRVAAPMMGFDIAELDLVPLFEEQRQILEEMALQDPSPYLISDYTFPYAFGPLLVHDTWERRGADGVRALYAEPPTATQELLAYNWGGEPLAERFVDFAFPEVPNTHHSHEVASLGAWLVYLYAATSGAGAEAAREVALAASGDALAAYSDANTDAVSLLWQLAFTDSAQAEQFGEWAQASAADSEIDQQGTRVTLRASEATLPDWLVPPAAP